MKKLKFVSVSMAPLNSIEVGFNRIIAILFITFYLDWFLDFTHHWKIDSSDKIGSVVAMVSSTFANSSGVKSSGISSMPRDFNFSMLILNLINRSSRTFSALVWSLCEMRDLLKHFLTLSSVTSS